MDLGFNEILLLFCFSAGIAAFVAFVAVLSFMLGAFVVYRTKRDSSEPFIRRPEPKHGSVGQAGDAFEPGEDERPNQQGPLQYGTPEDEDIPMGGDAWQHLYGTPERRQQFMSDFQMTSQFYKEPQEGGENPEGEDRT